VILVFSSIVWIPAQLWRWSIKSTVWFFGPIFLLLNLGAEADPEKRKINLVRRADVLGWASFLYAVTVIGIAFISAIDLSDVISQKFSIGDDAPFTALGWWLVIDWGQLVEHLWQWFHLPAVVLAVICFAWLNRLQSMRDAIEKRGGSPDDDCSLDSHPGRTIYWLQRLKQYFAVIAMLVGLWYFAKWAHEKGDLPCWLNSILQTVF